MSMYLYVSFTFSVMFSVHEDNFVHVQFNPMLDLQPSHSSPSILQLLIFNPACLSPFFYYPLGEGGEGKGREVTKLVMMETSRTDS